MATIYVQFSDATETAISSVFGSPQDPEFFPFQGEVDDSDIRYINFIKPPLTPDKEEKKYSDAIQAHLDSVAVQHNYDNIVSAVSYADEPSVKKFQDDGRAFRAWRSAVWKYAYEQLNLVKSNARPKPTIEEFILELPKLIIA